MFSILRTFLLHPVCSVELHPNHFLDTSESINTILLEFLSLIFLTRLSAEVSLLLGIRDLGGGRAVHPANPLRLLYIAPATTAHFLGASPNSYTHLLRLFPLRYSPVILLDSLGPSTIKTSFRRYYQVRISVSRSRGLIDAEGTLK